MRSAAMLLLALPLAGCTALDLDPMAIACREASVQQAGWCDGAYGGGSGGAPAAPQGPWLASTAEGAIWIHDLKGGHDRHTFTWESPGRATLTWGTGSLRVSVRDARGTLLYESPATATSDTEALTGRAGGWSVVVEPNNFSGRATVQLRAS